MNNLLEKIYNPDVLSCLANLSNDEVFTPPEVANKMIDLLPKELFESDKTTFLDPCCKSGVFLREMMKRLLNAKFPNYEEKIALINEKKMNKEKLTNDEMRYEKALQEKIDWVCHNQLYGISITRLTSLLSRRSLYCSKNANSRYSISKFDTDYGHIMYVDMKHTFKNGKCIYCGASESEYGEEKRGEELESHAYQFIHDENIVEGFNMKFDVIIGNPPYQLNDGGAQASAIPIYNLFVECAKSLNPQYLCMIIPSRWMTGGRGLDEFRKSMIEDKRVKVLHDYIDSKDCFSGVDIKGGVCYFLWEKHYNGLCNIYRHYKDSINSSKRYLKENGEEIFIRDERLLKIKNKVFSKQINSFDTIVSSMKPYGIRGDVFNNYKKYNLPQMKEKPVDNGYKIIGLQGLKRQIKYLDKTYPIPTKSPMINKYKLFITRNWGIGSYSDVPSEIILAKPKTICTETFVEIGPFETEKEAYNAFTYICTKFFRAMVAIRKQDQGSSKAVYHFVPLLNFDKEWDDKQLYKKFSLTNEEIRFIETEVKEMNLNDMKCI